MRTSFRLGVRELLLAHTAARRHLALHQEGGLNDVELAAHLLAIEQQVARLRTRHWAFAALVAWLGRSWCIPRPVWLLLGLVAVTWMARR